jgi:phosphatidylserine decarboxylase
VTKKKHVRNEVHSAVLGADYKYTSSGQMISQMLLARETAVASFVEGLYAGQTLRIYFSGYRKFRM